ncbi:MAG: PQQ-binding-like beta-propeller repeat protein, partial [Thermoguttaceae bacterium]
DDLGMDLIPLDDEPTTGAQAAKQKRPSTAKTRPKSSQTPAPTSTPKPPPERPAEIPVAALVETPPKALPKAPPKAPPASGSLVDEEFSSLQADAEGPLDGLTAATVGGSASHLPTPRKKGFGGLFSGQKKVGRKANVWDSPLLLVGGGALLGLVILGGVLAWSLTRQTGDEAFSQAKGDYDVGNYSQAIHKYTQYLEKFPKHASGSIARVHRGLARLRQKTGKGTRDWAAALQEAKDVLGDIASENEFKQAHADLSAMLPEIAQGLADQAQQEPKTETVTQAEDALAMIAKYVPKSLQRPGNLADIRASLALSNRQINRGEVLRRAIDAMKRAVDAGSIEEAYNVRGALLKQYPDLDDDESLRDAVLEVSQAQQAAVHSVEQPQTAETSEPTSAVLSAVALVQQTVQTPVPNVAGRIVLAGASGAVYGLDASNGNVLWRRFLGFGSNGRGPDFFPILISDAPGADALLVAPSRNELMRVESATGKLRWRHPIGEPFDAQPVLVGGRVLVATRSGRLVTIDVASGSSAGYLQLPQPLAVPPAVDRARGLIFQVAEHSNLYVLGLEDGQCRKVYHLGHEPGAVTAPPVVAGRYLMIAINDRLNDSSFRILSINEAAGNEAAGDDPAGDEVEEGLTLQPLQQLRLEGHVDTPPSVAGTRVLVTTDIGAMYVYEFTGTEEKKPLSPDAQQTVASGDKQIRFAWMEDGYLLLADHELTRYDIHSSQNRLANEWVAAEGSVFEQPPRVIDGTVFHVRRKVGMPGVLVAANEIEKGRRYWETRLTARPVTEPVVDTATGRVTVVTSAAAVYRIDATATGPQQPLVSVESDRLPRPVGHVIRVGNDLLAMTTGEGARQMLVFDATQAEHRLRWLPLPDPTGCSPIAYGGGLLVPTKIGQVFLLDPRSGQKLAEPFQPVLQGGSPPVWQLPALTDDGKVLLSDGRTNLYCLEVASEPIRHLAASQQAELTNPIISAVASCGNAAYAVDATGALNVFRLPELTPAESPVALKGRPVWGPGRVGAYVMLATDDNQLYCFDGAGKLVWQTVMAHGPLAGRPLPIEDGYVAASLSGVVWRIDAKTGEQLGKVETGRPLGCGPVRLGTRLLLGGFDGTLYQIQLP